MMIDVPTQLLANALEFCGQRSLDIIIVGIEFLLECVLGLAQDDDFVLVSF